MTEQATIILPGSNPACDGIFPRSSHTSDLKIGTPVAALPGAWRYRSVLGLVSPVSVYYNWVRWKVGSATSISVWQHVKLFEQIRPRDALACCRDVKQPTISWWSIGLEDDITCASYLWVREWLCRPILDLQSRAQSGHWKYTENLCGRVFKVGEPLHGASPFSRPWMLCSSGTAKHHNWRTS